MASPPLLLLLLLACCAAPTCFAAPNYVPVIPGTPFGTPYGTPYGSPYGTPYGYPPGAPLVQPVPGAPYGGGGAVPTPVQQNGKSDTTTIGQCLSGDKLLHVETVRKSAKLLQVRHKDVEYPPAWQQQQQAGTISCVQLVDLKGVNSGSAVIQRGGPGQRQVSVRVKSERGHSVAWTVLVYGQQ